MRYAILVLLNLPIIFFAFVNFITQYKLNKIEKSRFQRQMIIWTLILLILICSFPLYNLSIGRPLLESDKLDLLDIFQTTAIVYIIYVINNQRRKNEQNERLIRDLHQELSIRLSEAKNDKN
ncbi:hypothetical protein A2791_03735 [Candidatus Saccharibacteria bacterium RIFCSPHIGHO2_01_FULL_46_30]|nr:MAG: hypothetical protein A2791_03735 [Candidatus Saccharibacteria bacterium RIFCSPHIGHO2_01_FULL_46_30]